LHGVDQGMELVDDVVSIEDEYGDFGDATLTGISSGGFDINDGK